MLFAVHKKSLVELCFGVGRLYFIILFRLEFALEFQHSIHGSEPVAGLKTEKQTSKFCTESIGKPIVKYIAWLIFG